MELGTGNYGTNRIWTRVGMRYQSINGMQFFNPDDQTVFRNKFGTENHFPPNDIAYKGRRGTTSFDSNPNDGKYAAVVNHHSDKMIIANARLMYMNGLANRKSGAFKNQKIRFTKIRVLNTIRFF